MKGRVAVSLVAVAALLAAPAAPGAQEPWLSNDEAVLATLDPTGLPIEALLVSRVVSRGGEPTTILDPASTTNVRYRDRRGSPDLAPEGMLLEVGGAAEQTVLTEALFDQPLPVGLHAQYVLNGRSTAPASIVGASGDLEITYTVTNTTARSEAVSYVDAAGVPRGEALPVFVPLAGTLSVTVPDGLRLVAAVGAVQGTDIAGRTTLRYGLHLAPPVGDFQQQFTLTLTADRGATPETALTLAPVASGQDPALGFASGLIGESVAAAAESVPDALELDQRTGDVAAGAAALAAGTAGLTAGQSLLAESLAAGVGGAQQASAGADALAVGVADLSEGLRLLAGPDGLPASTAAAEEIAAAAVVLADIVGSSSDGLWRPVVEWPGRQPSPPSRPADLPAWAEALADIVAALQDVTFVPDGRPRDGVCEPDRNGDGTLDNPVGDIDCVPTLVQSLRALAVAATAAGAVADEVPGLLAEVQQGTADGVAAALAADSAARQAAVGARALQDELCGASPQLPIGACARLAVVAQDAERASAEAATAVETLRGTAKPLTGAAVRSAGLALGLPVLGTLLAGAAELAGAAGDGLRSGSVAQPGVVEALDLLAAALGQASGAAQGLAGGAELAAAGGEQLAAANRGISEGLLLAGDGAADLTAAADEVAAGADGLAAGAALLQEEGTARLLDSIVEGSADAALAEAYLAAVDARAADALPYGPPDGAVGHASYAYQMPATTPSEGVPVLAIAALIALAVLGCLAALRRRVQH